MQAQYDILNNVGLRIKSILVGRIYRKSISLSQKSRVVKSAAEISNLIAIDCEKIVAAITYLHYTWTAPLQIIVCIAVLAYFLHYAIIVGAIVMCALVITQIVLMLLFGKLRSRVLTDTDKRLRTSEEILNSIRVIKFFAWEDSFWRKVNAIRKMEVRSMSLIALIRAAINVRVYVSALCCIMCILLCFSFLLIDPTIHICVCVSDMTESTIGAACCFPDRHQHGNIH